MKLPNWQHHSKKEAKRTLKPQALRQAKKRRAALKAKLLASSVLLVGVASPAQAVTWGEFWEPFRGNHHHHVEHHHHYEAPRKCKREVKIREWVPGYYDGSYTHEGGPHYIPGRYRTRRHVRWVPCSRVF